MVSLRSDAYVDQYGAVEGAGWVFALAPNALLFVRRVVPVTALVTATALYLAASATQGDSNAPLAIPFFAYSVAVARSVRVSGSSSVGPPWRFRLRRSTAQAIRIHW